MNFSMTKQQAREAAGKLARKVGQPVLVFLSHHPDYLERPTFQRYGITLGIRVPTWAELVEEVKPAEEAAEAEEEGSRL